MIRRLLNALTVRYFFQFLLVWGLVVGPHGSLEALMLLDGDCATACPCDVQEDTTQQAEAEPCSDDCEDCSCKASFAVALAASTIGPTPARVAAERESTSRLLPNPGEVQDIFIPPIR